MAKEIERKYLVEEDDAWRGLEGVRYRQGYLCTSREATARVRVAGDQGYLTVKGETRGAMRDEFEYEIPLEDASYLLDNLCGGRIVEKVRRRLEHAGRVWEVDEFEGANRGLVVAEVELESEDQALTLPPWVGEEVTGDPAYYNARLAEHPYQRWRTGKAT